MWLDKLWGISAFYGTSALFKLCTLISSDNVFSWYGRMHNQSCFFVLKSSVISGLITSYCFSRKTLCEFKILLTHIQSNLGVEFWAKEVEAIEPNIKSNIKSNGNKNERVFAYYQLSLLGSLDSDYDAINIMMV